MNYLLTRYNKIGWAIKIEYCFSAPVELFNLSKHLSIFFLQNRPEAIFGYVLSLNFKQSGVYEAKIIKIWDRIDPTLHTHIP